MSPTRYTLRKSLIATFSSVTKNDSNWDDSDRLDFCCRSLHKCDAHKNVELDYSADKNIQHCECVHYFRICLKNLNTSLSSEVAFIHSINTTKCYAEYHPIVKCVKFENYLGQTADQYQEFFSFSYDVQFFNRCTKYEFDESQPRKMQLIDLPFIHPGKQGVNDSGK